MPMVEKRQRGRARLRCLLRGPDAVPSGCGRGVGRESWSSGLRPSQSVSKAERRKRGSRVHGLATALGVSFVSPETKEMLQPQHVQWFRDANKGRENISCHGQASSEIPSSAQDTLMLTRRIVPPGVSGKRNSNAVNADGYWSYCIEGIAAVLGSVVFGMILCCGVCVWWRRRE